MEEPKSEGEERAEVFRDEDQDARQISSEENRDPHKILLESMHEYDRGEPLEIAVQNVSTGGVENIQRGAARGRRSTFNPGAISRIVLDPEQPLRQQPPRKMKRTAKDGSGRMPSYTKPSPPPKEVKKKKEKKEKSEPKVKRKTLADLALTTAKRFWVTADVHKGRDPESYVIYSMRDFVIYLLFLVLTVIIAFGSLAYAYNYHANVLSEILTNSKFATKIGVHKTFKQTHCIQDIWLFIYGVLLPVLYTGLTMDGNATLQDPVAKFEGMKVLQENILIGAPQIRQVRVKSGTCSSASMLEDVYVSCYDYYDDETQDKSDFGPSTQLEFQYQPPRGLDLHYSGEVSSYGEGGFSMNFSRDLNFTVASLKQLQDNVWIRNGARAVFIDFTLYSANANLFCAVKLIFELIPAGGVVTRSQIRVLKLLRYVTPWDYFIAGCELVFFCYTIYFLMEECQQIKILKEYYLTNWWNLLDFAIVACSLATIALGIARLVIVLSSIKSKVMTVHTDQFASFDYLERIQSAFNVTVSILTFLVWFKLVKFSALNRSVSLIISTFGRVKLELLALAVMTVSIVLGFALLGNALFGSQVIQFRRVSDAFFTLFGLFIGGLYFYDECRQAARFSAQLFFVLYIFFVLVLFLSAFVALIVYGFHKAVNEIDDERDRVYLGDVCSQLCLKVLTSLKRKKLADNIKARQLAKLYKRDYDALLHVIRRHGYHGLDLALLLKKHDVRAGLPISFEAMSDVYNDLTTRNQLHMEVEEHNKIMEHIDRINKSIEFLDLTLADIVAKVDILANKLVDRPATRKRIGTSCINSIEKFNQESLPTPTEVEDPSAPKELVSAMKKDTDQKERRKETDGSPTPRKTSKKVRPSFGIFDNSSQRTTRSSLTASIHKAFTPRSSSKVSGRQDGSGGKVPQKQRKGAEFIIRTRKPQNMNFQQMQRRVWHLFFWVGTDDNEDIPEIILVLRQLAIYLIHLSIILSITTIADSSDYYSAVVLSDAITKSKFNTTRGRTNALGITFNDIRSPSEIWDFINQALVPVLVSPSSGESNKVLDSSVLIGAPQIRQVRGTKSDCVYNSIIQGLFVDCYDYYSIQNEDKEPFGLNTSAWQYKSDAERDVHQGYISNYGGGGYAMNITTLNFTMAWLKELQNNNWIRLGTRAVIITFAVATPNMYIAAKLVFELPPCGGVLPSSFFHTGQFNRFLGPRSYFVMSCEICLLIFTLFYSIHSCNAIRKRRGTSYFWISFDFIIISLSYAFIFLEVNHIITAYLGLQQVVKAIHTTESVSFDGLVRQQLAYECCGKLLACFAILKLFRFSVLIRAVRLIWLTFARVRFELLEVTIATVAVTMGFAVLGSSLFGHGVIQFRTVWEAFFSLLHLSVSSLYFYRECSNVSALGTSLFFPPYIAFILLVVATCVALVVFGFQKAADDMDIHQNNIYLIDVIIEAAVLLLFHFRFYRQAEMLSDLQIIRINQLEYESFVRILLRYRWEPLEIKLFMRSHHLYREKALTFTHLADAYNDFRVRHFLTTEVSGHDKMEMSIARINDIIDNFEITLKNVVTKAEALSDNNIFQKSRNFFQK